VAERAYRLVYRVHAVERMVERGFSDKDVEQILRLGKAIETYPTDFPFPSRLILGWVGVRPVHVVAADNSVDNEIIVITVYEPDLERWEVGFERRRT
jgi:Domain of unknown function (DUF4258)